MVLRMTGRPAVRRLPVAMAVWRSFKTRTRRFGAYGGTQNTEHPAVERLPATLAVRLFFVTTIATGFQADCFFLKFCPTFGCLYCLTASFPSPASPSCPAQTLLIARNKLLRQVFCRLSCIVTKTLAVPTHSIYRALAVEFAVE